MPLTLLASPAPVSLGCRPGRECGPRPAAPALTQQQNPLTPDSPAPITRQHRSGLAKAAAPAHNLAGRRGRSARWWAGEERSPPQAAREGAGNPSCHGAGRFQLPTAAMTPSPARFHPAVLQSTLALGAKSTDLCPQSPRATFPVPLQHAVPTGWSCPTQPPADHQPSNVPGPAYPRSSFLMQKCQQWAPPSSFTALV